MIKAVIFDIGGVLVNNSPVLEDIAETFDLDKNNIEGYFTKTLLLYEKGEIDESTFWKLLRERFKFTQPIPNPSPLIGRFQQEVKAVPEMVELIKDLKKRYKLAVISDTNEAHVAHLKTLGFLGLFDVLVFSYQVRSVKPEPEIFQKALSLLQVRPEETIFIDDKMTNVEGANKLGIHGIHFIDKAQLEKELAAAGINI